MRTTTSNSSRVKRVSGTTVRYYAEGFGFGPTWTGRSLANRYANKRDALRLAAQLGGYVTLAHHPFGGPDPIVTAPARRPKGGAR